MGTEQKRSLLIVDDRASNILALANILKPDYNVYVSKTGPDAIRVAAEKRPDVILLDVLMPVMDGYEVLAALKRTEKTRRIPVIFITSLNNAVDEEKGLELGAADYIGKPFSPAIVKLRVRNQILIVSQMRKIEELSMTDQLTGIPNRRSFDHRLELEWSRAIRDKLPLTLFMVDIDHFKDYNDAYGHQQGDAALRAVAQSFSRSVRRSTDFYARWGGEEFSILCPKVGYDDALNMAEIVRKEIEATAIPGLDGNSTHVTISIGLNTCVPKADSAIPGFVALADASLYAAKRAGRNRVGERIKRSEIAALSAQRIT